MAKNLKQIKKESSRQHQWIWDGVIKEGSVNILVGQQSRGKSMLATGLIKEMLKAKRGQTYLGNGVRQCRILYISTEMPESSIMERLSDIGVDGRMRNINKKFFVYYNPMPKFTDIEREINSCNPDFIILDILGGLVIGEGFEMNSYDAINTIVPRLKQMRNTFLIIHHMNKKGAAMGSIATLSAMDTRMEMLETDRDFDDNYNVIIYQSIHIYGKNVQDRYIDVAFKYPIFELAKFEEVEELDKPLSKLIQSVIMASFKKNENDEITAIEGSYQEVAAQCGMIEKYQFNPKRLGLLIKANEDTLKNNGIQYKIVRKNKGYHLKIWYDANANCDDEMQQTKED